VVSRPKQIDSWGSKIVERLAADLRAEFPDARGFSSANLRYMKSFAETWPDPAILQRLVGKLPWGQNIELLAVKDPAARLWYAEAVLENGWSRPVLAAQIDTQAHARHGKAVTNFARTLPPETSDLAQQVLKDPYQFDFLTLRVAAHERNVERALVTRVRDLLLGVGKRVFVHRQPASSRSRRTGFLCRPGLLSSEVTLPRGRRPQDGAVPAGTCGQDEFLSCRSG